MIALVTRTAVGKAVLLDRDVAISQDITGISFPDSWNPRFLWHWLRGQQGTLEGQARGATIKGVTREVVARLEVPEFPLEVQRRIAEILDRVDAQRSCRRAQLSRFDHLVFAEFYHFFGRTAWPQVALGDLVESAQIGLVRRAELLSPDLPRPYLRMNAILTSGRVDLKEATATEASYEDIQKYSARDGDFLFNTRNARALVGKSAVMRGEAALINNNILRLRFTEAMESAYLVQYLRSKDGVSRLDRLKVGTTSVFAIYQKDLMALRVPVPPVAAQREFAAVVAKIDAQRERIERALALEDELFASLQYRAFRGEL